MELKNRSFQHGKVALAVRRASFKQALRYCKRHKEQIQARYSNMQAKQFCD